VVEGGSREYLKPLVDPFLDRVRTNVNIAGVKRHAGGAEILYQNGKRESFDAVVFACHSDQALKLLADPSDDETAVLGAIPYQSNDVVLHTDTTLLPTNRLTWSCWNYQRKPGRERATLTYNMNLLQGIEAPETFCVTLNDSQAINPHKVLGRFSYDHPVFTVEGMAAQARWGDINGGATWFCGAYWRNGFHEDGVFSAKRVAEKLNSRASVITRMGSVA
jgi:predicted NAD/FAD-binding protein